VGTGFVLQCWQILAFTSAHALNFINRRFGSLFWSPRVPIGSLFHGKLGPYWVPISKHGGPYKFGEQCTEVNALFKKGKAMHRFLGIGKTGEGMVKSQSNANVSHSHS